MIVGLLKFYFVKRQLQVEFGEQTPDVDCIRKTFQRFCETGTVEDRQRSGRPHVIDEEKIDEVCNLIRDEITSISKQTLCDVFRNIVKRMNLCIHADGGHFEQLL